MWGSMGGGGVSEGEKGGGGRRPPPPPRTPPKRSPTPPPNPPPTNESFLSSRPTKATMGPSPGPKGPTPPPPPLLTTTTTRPTEVVPAPEPTNPPKTATTTPPHQDRHPAGCREEGRPSRGSDHRDGRPRTLPQRGREGHRPCYPRAEKRCRLGGIPGRHHPQ